jgi:cytochrome c oxidase cbb3-type subunit 3
VKVASALAAAALVASTFVGARAAGQTFPAQQRPPGDPAVIARGKALYDVNCSLCHGPDLRGGQLNGPNLLRSQLALSDQSGELILPIVRGARAERGMPPIPLPDDDVKAVAEYVHSILALSPRQGMPPPGAVAPALNVLVGDAAAGEKFFAATCSGCHAVTGDLQGIATRIPDPKTLQNTWVSGVGDGRGGRGMPGSGPAGAGGRAVTVTVTLPSGEKAEGRLVRIDDFAVSLLEADGSVRTIRRDGDRPAVVIHDPLEPHRQLLAIYTDKNMHDVTAYLATLK